MQQIFIILGLVAFFAGFIWMWRRSIQRVEDTQPPPAPRPIEETPEYKKVQAGGFRAWTFEQTLEPLSSEQQPGDEANSAWANDPLLNELRRLDQVEGKPSGYDISPDGAELLVLHGDDCATLFDIASGKAVKSWTNITPPEWRGAGGEVTALSCAGRRMIICVGEYPGEVVSIELEAGEARLLEDIGDEYGEATVITAMISGDGRYAVHFMVYSKGHSVFDLELQSSWVSATLFWWLTVQSLVLLFPVMAPSSSLKVFMVWPWRGLVAPLRHRLKVLNIGRPMAKRMNRCAKTFRTRCGSVPTTTISSLWAMKVRSRSVSLNPAKPLCTLR